jgi:PAS domain S-box-containing protein
MRVEHPFARYAFAVVAVLIAFGLREVLKPQTGTGAPFVLFFGAVMASSLAAGRGPAILAALLSLPLGAYFFVMRAGYTLSQSTFQGALFAVDCAVVIYLSTLITHSEARVRGLIDLAPDPFFLFDLDSRCVDVNEAACRMLGYTRDELVGRRIGTLLRNEDAPRVAAERKAMLASGQSLTSEWALRRKDGSFVVAEMSAKILADGHWQVFVRDITERKRREDERRVFVSLLENSSDFIGIADADGKPIYLNPAGRQMVGLPPDFPVEQTHIQDYYPPSERRFANEVILKSMIERGRWSGETFFRHWQTGQAIPVSDEHFMIRNPADGRILGMGTVTRDISEARRAREQLRLSEARFSGIISMSSDAIIVIDEHQQITLFNPGAERIFGYSSAEMVGAPLETLLPERLSAPHRRHVADFAAGPETARSMAEHLMAPVVGRRKNGDEFPAEASISKLEIAGSAVLTVALRDITVRERLAKRQRFLFEMGTVLASSLDYEQTLVNVGQLVVRDHADWCIIDLVEQENRVRRLKVVNADPQNASLAAQLEQVSLDRGRSHLTKPALDTRRAFVVERVTRRDLESFAQNAEHLALLRTLDPKSIMGLPLIARGELLGALVLISCTPSRLYRQDDVHFGETLADRAALAIDNGRLYQTAVRATCLRDETLGVVAHDLRNPLSAIMIESAVLRRRGPDPERRNLESVDAISLAANRMNRLIQDLLDVTLIESGQLGLQRKPLSIRQLVSEAIETQRPLAAASGLDVRVDLTDDLPQITADRHRLLQVLENLIGNALKFTPPGGHITIGAASRGAEALFRVVDNGCGIAPSDAPHVFDRFWQAKKGRSEGAGLGLPIARGIVEAHAGRIWVESLPGGGTSFFFTIPTVDQAEQRGGQGTNPPHASTRH